MIIGIYPGSFDPITLGHIDIINRSVKFVDKLIIAVLKNNNKNPLFNADERIDMIINSLDDETKNKIEVKSFEGLLIDFAKKENAKLIIRGLRAITDFEYEMQMDHTNKTLYRDIETIFLNTDVKYSYLSSSIVKEVSSFKGDISHFVTEYVEKKLHDKLK